MILADCTPDFSNGDVPVQLDFGPEFGSHHEIAPEELSLRSLVLTFKDRQPYPH
jgi:hypothetical protein